MIGVKTPPKIESERGRQKPAPSHKALSSGENEVPAHERVEEAEKALSVARQQAGNATVTAPLPGVVTKINSEVGRPVGSQGVLTLVSVEPEIRLNVDESNLPALGIGHEAVISSGAFSNSTFRGPKF